MSGNRFRTWLLVAGMLMLFQAGCGGPSDQPELGQVTGTVTLDGKPLSGVAVVFQPVSGRPATGMTDAEGKYELTYIRETKGTKVGSNRVEIAPSEDGEAEESADEGEESAAGAPQAKPGKPKVPARYNVESELKVDVKPGENTFDFKLES
ncbi:MAG: Ig-like domain-containing protein [Aureliella sp.]